QGQRPHPRGYAAFARLAAPYLSGGRGTGCQQAARHLAAHAANVYGLRDRGRLAPGMAADICVIGPGGLTAHATYAAPLERATGVDLVIVNGAVVWRAGQPVTTPVPAQVASGRVSSKRLLRGGSARTVSAQARSWSVIVHRNDVPSRERHAVTEPRQPFARRWHIPQRAAVVVPIG